MFGLGDMLRTPQSYKMVSSLQKNLTTAARLYPNAPPPRPTLSVEMIPLNAKPNALDRRLANLLRRSAPSPLAQKLRLQAVSNVEERIARSSSLAGTMVFQIGGRRAEL